MARTDRLDDSVQPDAVDESFLPDSNLNPETYTAPGGRPAGDSALMGERRESAREAGSALKSNLPLIIGAVVLVVVAGLVFMRMNQGPVQVAPEPKPVAGAPVEMVNALQAKVQERDAKIGALETSVEKMRAEADAAQAARDEATRLAQQALEQGEAIRRELADVQKKQAAAIAAAEAARRAERPQPAPRGYSVRAVTTGLAWITLPAGEVVSVGEGVEIPGLGRVDAIDEMSQTVRVGRMVIR